MQSLKFNAQTFCWPEVQNVNNFSKIFWQTLTMLFWIKLKCANSCRCSNVVEPINVIKSQLTRQTETTPRLNPGLCLSLLIARCSNYCNWCQIEEQENSLEIFPSFLDDLQIIRLLVTRTWMLVEIWPTAEGHLFIVTDNLDQKIARDAHWSALDLFINLLINKIDRISKCLFDQRSWA